jgi:hypothetical protein
VVGRENLSLVIAMDSTAGSGMNTWLRRTEAVWYLDEGGHKTLMTRKPSEGLTLA